MTLSSPNKMIWSCFRSIHRNIESLDSHDSEEAIKDIAASTIVLSVTAVETFINMYFRVLVEEEKYKPYKNMVVSDSISKDGARVKGLKQKLNSWPNNILGKNISQSILITADKNLAIAAENENIRAWNCLKEPKPKWA